MRFDQQIGAGAAVLARIDRNVDRLHRPRRPRRRRPAAPVRRRRYSTSSAKRSLLGFLLERHRAAGERAVGGEQHAVGIDQRGQHPGCARAVRRSVRRGAWRRPSSDRAAPACGKRHSSRSPLGADPLDLDRGRARRGRDARRAAAAVAPRHALTSSSDCAESSSLPSVKRRTGAAEPLAIGAVGDQQAAFAVGQRGRAPWLRPSAEPIDRIIGRQAAAARRPPAVRARLGSISGRHAHHGQPPTNNAPRPADSRAATAAAPRSAPPRRPAPASASASAPLKRRRVDRGQLLVEHLPDADALLAAQVELLARLDVERRVPGVEVAHDRRRAAPTASADR